MSWEKWSPVRFWTPSQPRGRRTRAGSSWRAWLGQPGSRTRRRCHHERTLERKLQNPRPGAVSECFHNPPSLQFRDPSRARAAALMMQQVNATFSGPLHKIGTRDRVRQKKADAITAALRHPDLNLTAAAELTGISQHMWRKVTVAGEAVNCDFPRAERIDKVSLLWVVEWFHLHSPDVEPDKSRKDKYKGTRKHHVGGAVISVKCIYRLLTCSSEQAVDHFFDSAEYREYISNGGTPIRRRAVESCICPCIHPMKRKECACPYCTDLEFMLEGARAGRKSLRAASEPRQCGLDCSNPDSEWCRAMDSTDELCRICTCPKKVHHGLELPHLKVPESFYCLPCCKPPPNHNNVSLEHPP